MDVAASQCLSAHALAGYVIGYGVPVSWPVGADARRENCEAPERTGADSDGNHVFDATGLQVCIIILLLNVLQKCRRESIFDEK